MVVTKSSNLNSSQATNKTLDPTPVFQRTHQPIRAKPLMVSGLNDGYRLDIVNEQLNGLNLQLDQF